MSQIFISKTNRAFYQIIFMGFIAFIALALTSFKAYQLSGLYLETLIHKIKDACGCESMAQFFAMHPDIFRAVILFGVGIGIFIIYSLYKLLKLNSQTKKYIGHYLSFAKARHSIKLKEAIKSLGIDKARVVEINKSDDLAVFCFGYWQPKICISSALADLLDKKELIAVLIHEARHMDSYEPLKLFIVKYFRSIFFFLPGLKTSEKKYLLFSELAADEQASGIYSGRFSLASAMLKISEQEEKLSLKRGASLSYFSSGIEERANRLSDEVYIPNFKFLEKSLIFGSLGLAVVSFLFIFVFSSGTKAFEMHNIADCVAPLSSKSVLACTALENNPNALNAGSNNFQNINSASFEQHAVCQAD